ncbi:zinc ribbon domain-containing protein [Neobacillus sp. Marseille-QA0830]
MIYCRECGKSLNESAQFCPECGTPVNRANTHENLAAEPLQGNTAGQTTVPAPNQIHAEQSASRQAEAARATEKQPMPAKTRNLLIASGVVLVLLFGGYKTAETLTSKDRLIDKFESALVEKDGQAVAKLLSSTDKKAEINEKTVKGFMKYYKNNPDEVSGLIETLKNQSKYYDQTKNANTSMLNKLADGLLSDGAVNLEKSGKFLFFDTYKINVDMVYLNLSTNYKDTTLYLDKTKLGKATKPDYEKTYGPYLPGIYNLKAELKTDFTNLVTKKEVTLMGGADKKEVSLTLDGKDVTVDLGADADTSSVKGKLFINGKDVGVNPFENPTFGPVLTDGSMKLSVEAETPWGKIKTKEVPIKGQTVHLNLGNDDAFQTQIIDQVLKFQDQYLMAVTSGDTSKLTTATTNGTGSTQDDINSNAEDGIKYKGKHLSTVFDLDSFDVSYQDGVWVVTVDTEEKFNEAYYYEGENAETESAAHDVRYYLTYDKGSKAWLVDSQDETYSFNDEHVKEKTVEKPVEYTTTYTGAETAASMAATEVTSDITDLMSDYLHGLINAINDNEFSEVSSYLYPDSQLYKDQQALVKSLNDKKITEDLLDFKVTDYSGEGGQGYITTDEKIKINYADGTSETKEYHWYYSAETYSDGNFRLTNIQEAN